MTYCVQDILDNTSLQTRLLAGAAGVDRAVRWAHVCELMDPTEWLGEGYLLMTTGIGIPVEPEAQKLYVQRLAKARLAGVMIGENMQAPADLTALQVEAERLGLPVMMTFYSVPFSAVTRAILDASKEAEYQRRQAVSRMYESARLGLQGLGLADLLIRLSKDVHAQLYLFDARTLQPWQDDLPALPESWCVALEKRELPASASRCSNGETEALTIGLPSMQHCHLLGIGGEFLDYGLLHHLVGVLSMELERLQAEHQRLLRLGSELLDDLLQQRITERSAQERLTHFDCAVEQTFIAITKVGGDEQSAWLRRLARLNTRIAIRLQGDELITLFSLEDTARQIQAELGCNLGQSNALGRALRAPEALREARLALAHCGPTRPLVAYAQARDEQSWLPSSLDEAARVHRLVLGHLADYDKQQGARFEHTLRVFLEDNRSWQKAAQRLNIHKQTLVYRIRRIEEITGRSLESTEDVTALWIALRSAQIAGIEQ